MRERGSSFPKEFSDFAVKGNAVDLASIGEVDFSSSLS
jgi:hypothetical protein